VRHSVVKSDRAVRLWKADLRRRMG
jgi:hypothetical protein